LRHPLLFTEVPGATLKTLFAAAAFLLHSISAHAFDSVSVAAGKGDHNVNMWAVGLQWVPHPEWLAERHWDYYWDVTLGNWHGDTGAVHDFGVTPVLRYARHARGWYFEGGIGAHVFSDSHVSSDLGFSTRFQFGDHVGVGYRFHTLDWTLRLQHVSNGGMRNPNPGINSAQLRLVYHFD
jgi:hypothetical protein